MEEPSFEPPPNARSFFESFRSDTRRKKKDPSPAKTAAPLTRVHPQQARFKPRCIRKRAARETCTLGAVWFPVWCIWLLAAALFALGAWCMYGFIWIAEKWGRR